MGMKYRELIDKLVGYAHAALDEKRKSTFAFDSEILNKISCGAKAVK